MSGYARKKAAVISVAFVVALIVAAVAASSRAASKNGPAKERKIRITTEEALFNVEGKSFTIPGEVTMEIDDLSLHGRGLSYDEAEKTGAFTGGPVDVEEKTRGIRGIMANVRFNLEKKTVNAWGGCVFNLTEELREVRMEADKLDLDTEGKTVVADSGATLHYKSKKQPGESGGDDNIMGIGAREFDFSAGHILFDYGAETLIASRAPVVKFERGLLKAPEIRASMKDSTVSAENVEIEIDDVRATAAKAVIYYLEERAELDGGVTAVRNGETLRAAKIIIGYSKGGRYVRLVGKGVVDMIYREKKTTGEGAPEKNE